jgi:hypothetical protein
MLSIVAVLALTWGPRATLAAPGDVGLLPVEAPGQEAEGARLQAVLESALGELSGKGSHPPAEMRLDEARLTFSCFDESEACMAQVGELLQVGRLIWGTLERKGDVQVLRLALLDVTRAAFVRRERFERTGADAIEQLERDARAFVLGRPVAARPLVEFRSVPPGAVVMVDGESRGATPLTLELAPGTHPVELRLPGHQPVARELNVPASGRTVVDERLAPLVTARTQPTEASADTGFWLGIGAGGVAVVSAGFATALGLRTLELRDDAQNAETQRDNDRAVSDGEDKRLLTNVAWGVAAAAAATSAYFFFFYDDDDGSSAGVGVSPGGFSLGGRF